MSAGATEGPGQLPRRGEGRTAGAFLRYRSGCQLSMCVDSARFRIARASSPWAARAASRSNVRSATVMSSALPISIAPVTVSISTADVSWIANSLLGRRIRRPCGLRRPAWPVRANRRGRLALLFVQFRRMSYRPGISWNSTAAAIWASLSWVPDGTTTSLSSSSPVRCTIAIQVPRAVWRGSGSPR